MKKALLILFVLVPSLLTVSVFALPDKEISEKENRSLTVKQSISHNIKDGSFQADLESYLSDQFPLREQIVYAQSRLRYALGQREIGGAYICKAGRLMQKITDADINKNSLFAYADKIDRIAEKYPVYVMYVPSAGAVNKAELPAGAAMYDYDTLYSELTAHLGNAGCIDLSKCLSSAEYYYKTDHHWNADGAYNAYAEFCAAKGEAAKAKESFALKSVATDFRGTLYSKALITKATDEILLPQAQPSEVTADGKSIDFYDYSALEMKDKYNIFQGGNHGITEITGAAENGKTLIIFKDSFANSFVPFIVNDYSKIILVDERYAFISAEDFVNQTDPDEVLVLREIVN